MTRGDVANTVRRYGLAMTENELSGIAGRFIFYPQKRSDWDL